VTLRVRLTVALVALVAAGLVVSDVATYTALRSYLVKRVDQQLLSSSRQVLFALSSPETPGPGPGPGDGDPILPSGTFGVILDSSGAQVGQPVVFNYGGDVLPPPVLPATIHRGTLREPSLFTVGSRGDGPQYRAAALGLPDGSTLGDAKNLKLRFDPAYMALAAAGTL